MPRDCLPLLLLPVLLTAFLTGCVAAVVGTTAVTAVDIAQDRRTTGAYIDDALVEFEIRRAFQNDDDIRELAHLSVTSMNGIVLLTGEAPTREIRDRALSIARSEEEVRQVVNEIRIAGPTTWGSRANDSWITTKVKTLLFREMKLDANRVKVVTEYGHVYLMGLVTRDEADRATELARSVSGVVRVVRVFEFVDAA